MIKECEICGKIFDANRSNRKYCDECSPNSDRLKVKMAKELARNKRDYYNPKLQDYICSNCNKAFKIPPDIVVKGKGLSDDPDNIHFFCSVECRKKWSAKHMLCRQCLKPINGAKGVDPDKWQTQFCSPECRQAYMHKTYSIPKIKPKPKATEVQRIEFCPVCNKRQIKIYPIGKIPNEISRCSEECEKKWQKHLEIIKKERRESVTKLYSAPRTKKKETFVSLCATCKTSYNNCYLMKSDFRNDPKGAKRDSKGNIISCPLFS